MEVVVAIDQGTSSSRVICYDRAGNIVASAQTELKNTTPQPGWLEQDPHEILSTTISCIDEVMSADQRGFEVKDVVAAGITNQRESTVVWDKNTGEPLHNVIVWSDSRTSKLCSDLEEKVGSKDHFRDSCGLPISTYFSAMKLRWLIDNSEKVQEAIREDRVLSKSTVDRVNSLKMNPLFNLSRVSLRGFTGSRNVSQNLTGGPNGGVHITDVSNASRTMLMNLKSRTWDDETCRILDIPMKVLPEIRSSSELYGTFASSSLKGVKICGCIGDQQGALMGQLCFSRGDAKNTYGTGCFMLMNTGEHVVPSNNGLLTTVAFQLGPSQPVQYALEGAVAAAGSGVRWLRDNLGFINTADEIEDLARQVDDTGGVYFVPAFSGLLAPYWQPDARGVICGLSFFSNKSHIARALLEACCFQTREVLDAMEADSGVSVSTLKIDGGMSKNKLMCQLQADIGGIPVVRPASPETTALGAAICAGLATGFWSSLDDVRTSLQTDSSHTSYKPNSENNRVSSYDGWKAAAKLSFSG